MSNRLKYLMYTITIYLGLLGLLFTFFPGIARASMGIALSDEALTLLYGQVVLALAFMAYLVASNLEQLSKMTAGFIALFGGHILVFGYQLASGIQTFAQVGPPLILSVVFTVLLLIFQK